jgi:hypothetical protein
MNGPLWGVLTFLFSNSVTLTGANRGSRVFQTNSTQ